MKKEAQKYNKKERKIQRFAKWLERNRFNILYSVVMVIFVGLTIIMGLHHEPWADESQAWLIARDSTVAELFTSTLHFDGHPALWHLILKFFQTIGLSYEYFFVMPIIFSSIGVALFLFRSKFPWYLKIMFPFTYAILFQYTIVARGYCLLLPLLAWLACIWNEKYKKVWQFTTVMILLISAEVYSLLFAAGVYLYYFYGIFKRRGEIEQKWKYVTSFLIITVCFIGTAIYAFPAETYTFNQKGLSFSLYFLSDSFMSQASSDAVLKTVMSLGIFAWILVGYLKSKHPKQFFQFMLFLTPIILFMMVKYHSAWHYFIVLLVALFCFWVHGMEKNKWILALLGITFIVQIYWSIWSCVYDYQSNYGAAKDAAEFLQDYQGKEIYGSIFEVNAINAYYDHNIFANWDDKGYFNWDSRGKFFEKEINEQALLENDFDVVVVAQKQWQGDDSKLGEKYEIHEFSGIMFFEDRPFSDESIKIYVRKDE